jgi:ABC-type sugar transport system substrate-binding protein
MFTQKRLVALTFVLALSTIMVLTACQPAPAAPATEEPAAEEPAAEEPAAEEPAESGSKGVIAFSQASMENEARVQIQLDMERAVVENGYEFIWANAANDPAKQLADVEDLLSQSPDLLVIAPVEAEPLATVPEKAQEAGVPLIVIDREIPGTVGEGSWIALLTNDFAEAGRAIFQDMVDYFERETGSASAKVVHITGQSGASPVIDEQRGIDMVLENYPDIEIIATCDGLYQAEPSRKCMEDLLQRFAAGEIDAVFADSDTIGLGALEAIRSAGRDELLGLIWGRDGSVPWLEEMLNDNVATTYQTIIFYGDDVVRVFEEYKATGTVAEPTYYATGELFTRWTEEGKARCQERINELNELGLGCCFVP